MVRGKAWALVVCWPLVGDSGLPVVCEVFVFGGAPVTDPVPVDGGVATFGGVVVGAVLALGGLLAVRWLLVTNAVLVERRVVVVVGIGGGRWC